MVDKVTSMATLTPASISKTPAGVESPSEPSGISGPSGQSGPSGPSGSSLPSTSKSASVDTVSLSTQNSILFSLPEPEPSASPPPSLSGPGASGPGSTSSQFSLNDLTEKPIALPDQINGSRFTLIDSNVNLFTLKGLTGSAFSQTDSVSLKTLSITPERLNGFNGSGPFHSLTVPPLNSLNSKALGASSAISLTGVQGPGLTAPQTMSGLGFTLASSGPGGSGPTILFIDDGADHQKATSTIGQRFGPNAQIITEGISLRGGDGETQLPGVLATGPDLGIDAWIDSYSQIPETYAALVKEKADAHPDAKVINMSFGSSRKNLYDSIYTGLLADEVLNGEPLDPTQINALNEKLGITDPQLLSRIQSKFAKEFPDFKDGKISQEELIKLANDPQHQNDSDNLALQSYIAKYVDSRMDAPDSAFNKSLAVYQQTTKELADRGQTLVVAAGNNHSFGQYTKTQFADGSPDQEFNMLAMSDNVISVAASKDNNPNTTIASFSSRGGGKWQPTIAADGVDTNTRVYEDGVQDEDHEVENGTSFSAPTVSGAIAEYLKAHPGASFSQIKADLVKTADDTSATAEEEGAGILDYKEFTGMSGPDNDDASTWPTSTSSPTSPATASGPSGSSGPGGVSDQEFLELAKRRDQMFDTVAALNGDSAAQAVLDRMDELMGRGGRDGKFSADALYDLANVRLDDATTWRMIQNGLSGPELTLEDRKRILSTVKTLTQVSTDEDNLAEITGEKRPNTLVFDSGDMDKWLDTHKSWNWPGSPVPIPTASSGPSGSTGPSGGSGPGSSSSTPNKDAFIVAMAAFNDGRARELMDWLEWDQNHDQAQPHNGRFGVNGMLLLSQLDINSDKWEKGNTGDLGPAIPLAERQRLIDAARLALDPASQAWLNDVNGGDGIFDWNDIPNWLAQNQ